MYMLNITDDYEFLNNCANEKDDDNNIIFEFLLRSITSSILFLCLINLIIWTIFKPLVTNK